MACKKETHCIGKFGLVRNKTKSNIYIYILNKKKKKSSKWNPKQSFPVFSSIVKPTEFLICSVNSSTSTAVHNGDAQSL